MENVELENTMPISDTEIPEIEKIKVKYAKIVVTGNAQKPYFNIEYLPIDEQEVHIGYSSYFLDHVFGWLEQCFEVVKEYEEVK